MLLAILNCWLIALERSLVNPFYAFALVLWDTCAGHQEPACSKLCLGIATIGCQLIPKDTLFEVLLYAIAIPKGCTHVLLTQYMTLEGC